MQNFIRFYAINGEIRLSRELQKKNGIAMLLTEIHTHKCIFIVSNNVYFAVFLYFIAIIFVQIKIQKNPSYYNFKNFRKYTLAALFSKL